MTKLARRAEQFAAPYRVTKGSSFRLAQVDPADTGRLESADAKRAKEVLQEGVEHLRARGHRIVRQERTNLARP